MISVENSAIDSADDQKIWWIEFSEIELSKKYVIY